MPIVTVRNARFQVTEDQYAAFWPLLSSGQWEPATFDVFDRCITKDTSVLDVGGWIGATALYAATRGRQVFAFEPDPVAFDRLRANINANPHLMNIEAIQAFVSDEPGEVRMGSRNKIGDSGSSILFARGENSWSVPAIRLDQFIRSRGVPDPLFIKVDIEGAEYRVLPAMLRALKGRDFWLYLSTHPHVLWESMPGGGTMRRLTRRAKMISAQGRLVRALHSLPYLTDSNFKRLSWRDMAPGLLRGQDLTFDRSLIGASMPKK